MMDADELSKLIMNDAGVKRAIEKVIKEYVLSLQPPSTKPFDREVKIINDYSAKSGILVIDFRDHDSLKARILKKFLPARLSFRATWKEYSSLPPGWNFALAQLGKLKTILDEEGVSFTIISKHTFPSTSTPPPDNKPSSSTSPDSQKVTLITKTDPKYGYKIITNEHLGEKYIATALRPYGNCIVGVKDASLEPNIVNPYRAMKPLQKHHILEIREILTKIPIFEPDMIDGVQDSRLRDTLRAVYMC